jgi:hypothetical protein
MMQVRLLRKQDKKSIREQAHPDRSVSPRFAHLDSSMRCYDTTRPATYLCDRCAGGRTSARILPANVAHGARLVASGPLLALLNSAVLAQNGSCVPSTRKLAGRLRIMDRVAVESLAHFFANIRC